MSDAFAWPEFLPAFRVAAQDAGFREEMLGQTADGPVCAWTKAGDGPHVYLSAGMHGDEPAGPLAILKLMQDGFFASGMRWSLCPAVNPTGLARLQRENAEGIDLNRDYWKRETAEVQAHAGWLDRLPTPDLFLSLHEDWETRGFYFYEINLGKDRPERAQAIIDAVRPWFPPEPERVIDGHRTRTPGWIYHEAEADVPEGWPEAIYLAKHGCPLSFTFETPSLKPMVDRIAAHCAAVKAAAGQV